MIVQCSIEDIKRLVDISMSDVLFYSVLGNHIALVQRLVVLQREKINLRYSYRGQRITPLHAACRKGYCDMIEILLENGADIQAADSNGDAPIHTVCRIWKLNCLNILLGSNNCNPNQQNADGDTALHIVCGLRQNTETFVKALIAIPGIDPEIANHTGLTPVEVAGPQYFVIQIINNFLKQKQSSLQTYLKIFVVGNSGTGKSTLIKAVTTEASQLLKYAIFPKMKFVKPSDVPPHTAGIVPIPFKHFGHAVLYDFAGQHEYYSSHAAVMENLILPTPPLFLLLIDISKPIEEIKEELVYWWQFINNLSQRAAAPPHVMFVGSHKDKVRARGEDPRSIIDMVLKDSVRDMQVSFRFEGSFPMDCRKLVSRGLGALLAELNTSCQVLRQTADVDLHCHILKAFLTTTEFKELVVCRISQIFEKVKSDDALLPQNPSQFISLLSALSDQGHILLLQNHTDVNLSWVILKPEVLLAEVNGSIFAPHYFKEHSHNFAMSTGVVGLGKIRKKFTEFHYEAIVEFLIHLEFCFRIKDKHTLEMITKNEVSPTDLASETIQDYSIFPAIACNENPVYAYQRAQNEGSPTNEASETIQDFPKTVQRAKNEVLLTKQTPKCQQKVYYFFPSLVCKENPTDVFLPQSTDMYQCGWFYKCHKETEQLTTRFLHVLILRLAFSCEPPDDPTERESVVLLRSCSVWKHGIAWWTNDGIETIVEVGLQCRWVAVMMRCPHTHKVQCAELRSKVIAIVLKAKQDFCQATKMNEFLIAPSCLQYPFKGKELTLYSMIKIASVVIDGRDFAKDIEGKNPLSISQLLPFEPYYKLGYLIGSFFTAEQSLNEEISQECLEQIAIKCHKNVRDFETALQPNLIAYEDECLKVGGSEVQKCIALFHTLKNDKKRAMKSWKDFKREFSRFSIFCGRNPLDIAAGRSDSAILCETQSTIHLESGSDQSPGDSERNLQDGSLQTESAVKQKVIESEDQSQLESTPLSEPVHTSTDYDKAQNGTDAAVRSVQHSEEKTEEQNIGQYYSQQEEQAMLSSIKIGAAKQSVTESGKQSQSQPTPPSNPVENQDTQYYHKSKDDDIAHIGTGNAETKPLMKELANNVIPRVCFKWRDLGLQLNIDYWVLDEIQANCPGNVRECCTRMLAQWLSLDAGASWSTLVAALTSRAVNEKRLAASLSI